MTLDSRWRSATAAEILVDLRSARTGLSGLFQGPVVNGGRRAWDWNPNSRASAERRWYSGLDRDDWVLIERYQANALDPWPMFGPSVGQVVFPLLVDPYPVVDLLGMGRR